ncbi:sensor histidine kinase [Nocardioides antri]|uniref:sensor histidine kinase n=1 Tax=Nocardioides antri TaxID=2607659 RepID=UPI00165F87CA|nr:histidine kinase [Nocardioides antri]
MARAVTWPLVPALILGMVLVQVRRPGAPTSGIHLESVLTTTPYITGTVVSWAVGVVLTGRAHRQVAGWAFLGLGTALAWSGLTEMYAEVALTSEPGEMPHAELVATLSESSFLWWFLFLALILQFTPAPRSGPWRHLPVVTIVSTLASQVGSLTRSTRLETGGYRDTTSPWAIDGAETATAAASTVAVLTLGFCVLASVFSVARAFRRSRGEERQQLLWLVAGASPLAPGVIGSFVAAYAGHDELAGAFMAVGIVTITLGAAFSVAKYRLYDVERVVSESVGYALASGAVIAVFGLVVLVITRSIPTLSSTARWPTSVATLAAVAAARPAYLWARNAVDRRFNRRRFDAVQVVRAGLRRADTDLETLLREALGDPSVRVLFPAAEGWVTSSGHAAAPTGSTVDVVRDHRVGARIEFDPRRTESSVVEAVSQEAAADIDNLGLRAELARQVEDVTESRSRLAGAHLEERQRIERDLHDGAQQRLLAIALQLRSARINGAEEVLRDEVDRAIEHLGRTVQELRDLAAGLQPAALAGGGLRAAVEDLANRIPLHLQVSVAERRFPRAVESAAWFVVAEAVSNVVKHAEVDEVAIVATQDGSDLVVTVSDRGTGGADAQGSGLQGLADRVAALGGSLSVRPNHPCGTRVEARFPCGS